MKRRDFFKYSAVSTFLLLQNLYASNTEKNIDFITFLKNFFENKEDESEKKKSNIENKLEIEPLEETSDIEIKDNIKVRKKTDKNDVFLDSKYINHVDSVRYKLKKIQNYVGYGNFNLISFDKMLKIPEYTSIEKFSKEELEFLEFIFYYDPEYHGFYGNRISNSITDEIDLNAVTKIPHTGHYLFKGEPHKTYLRMCDDVGDTLILTSGIRSIVKQTKLFLDKLNSVDNNLSIASISLAPPAFSYHTVSDFDVGKKGFGYANFTSRFALTQEFLKMKKLDYVDIRYTIKNLDGVRYEPWHVKVV